MGRSGKFVIAMLGSAVYATAGFVIGSMNAGWFDLQRNANAWLPLLGLGAAFVVVAFRSSEFSARLNRAPLGTVAKLLLVLGPAMYVISWVIEFAIFGTLALGGGLICLAIAVWTGPLETPFDRLVITLSAIGSLTWNTETTSAFILVGVGLLWGVLSHRLLSRQANR